MKILRVFPRQTTATPYDKLVRIGLPDLFDPPECADLRPREPFRPGKERPCRRERF